MSILSNATHPDLARAWICNVQQAIFRIVIIAALIFVLASCGPLITRANTRSTGTSSRETQITATNTSTNITDLPVSRFIFGTNLSPYDDKYQVLTSPSTQNLLQQMHIQMVRIPMRNRSTEADITQAAQGVKKLNAAPLVNLYDPFYPKSQEENSKIIRIMNKVFGQTTVYYEYGSEDDTIDVSAEDYTAAWNKTIPVLKQLAPGAHFVGPATYHYTTQYLQTFLQQAHPLPDEVSWHEYACDSSESQETCMQRLSHWGNDIVNARTTMSKIIGKSLPIIISEWNYAANAKPDDGKSNDPRFLTAWTVRALQVLSDNQIFASMQYFCTGVTPLINKNALTLQGQVFRSQYEYYIVNHNQTTSISPVSPTSTPVQPPRITSNMTPAQIYQAATSGPLLYNSSLVEQNEASWKETAFGGGGSCSFTGSGYQANMPQRNYFAPCMAQALSYKNFTIQVEMTITSGSANDGGGIIFRDTGQGNYRFRVNLDGSWSLAPFNIGSTSLAIKHGLNQTNVLTIVAQGSDLYLFVNQKYLTHVIYSSFAAGQIGFMAVDWNSDTTVVFKNMNVWQLS